MDRTHDFESAKMELSTLLTNAGHALDNYHAQMDTLTLYGFLANTPDEKDAAIHFMGVYGRHKAAIVNIYHDAIRALQVRMDDTVRFSLGTDRERLDKLQAAVDAYIREVSKKVNHLGKSNESVRVQQAITEEFYSSEALV